MYNVIYFVYILKTYTVIASQFFFVILGDEIVCYVEKFFKDKCLVNFFTNGKLVYRHWGHMDKENVYATVGVKFGPAHLIVQWPKPGDFKIDIVCLKVFFFLYFRLKPVNWLKNRAIFAGLGCSVHIAPHKYLIIYSGLAKIPKFRKYLSIKFHGFMILKIEMFIYYFIYKQYLSCYMYQLMKCLYDV